MSKNDIDELVAAASDPAQSLSAILTRGKVLATKLGNGPLLQFVDHEIKGYETADSSLPGYRVSSALSVGTFAGPFGAKISGFRIPASSLPDNLRDQATHNYFSEPVSAIEAHLAADADRLAIPWPGDWVAAVAGDIIQNYTLMFASKPVSRGALTAVLAGVRAELLERLLPLLPESAPALQGPELRHHSDGLPHGLQPIIKVFISHSSRDLELAELVSELLRSAIGLHANEIRCTSVDAHRLPIGADAPDQLKGEIVSSPVFIGIVSEASLESAYVLFELGARWGSSRKLLPLLAPSTNPDVLPGPIRDSNAAACTIPQLQQLVVEVAAELGCEIEPTAAYQPNIERILKHAETAATPAMPQVIPVAIAADHAAGSSLEAPPWSPKFGLLSRILETFNSRSRLTIYELVDFIQAEHTDYTIPNIFQMREMLVYHGYLQPIDRDNFIPGRSIRHLFDWIYDQD